MANVMGHLEESLGRSSASMDNALRNTLTVKLQKIWIYLLEEMKCVGRFY